ncbi:hypothetical protein INR49_026808, partial [Caranx melampygus]
MTSTHGDEISATTGSTTGSHQSQESCRPKRKMNPNPAYIPSSPEDEPNKQPETEGNSVKRVRKEVDRDTARLKSKEYLAEGAEHIYRTHTCPTCRRCFKMRSHLQEHLHLHFPDPSLQCPTCKRYFTSKSKLRIHRLREAGEKLHRCHLCDYSAVERNAVHRHLASMHADEADDDINGHSYPCPTCGESFRQSRSLKAHMKMHNVPVDSKPVSCFQEACPFKSSLRKELLRHTVEVHRIKAVECRHHSCGAIFQTEADMETHYRTHLAYHCSQCDFSCSNKTVFLKHQRNGHPGDDKLCCDFCSFVTFNPVEFEQHIGLLHANEKIHRCSQCSYVTSHKRGLKRHMLMHSGEKPHKCSLCDFRCRDESYLSKHMLTHSDDKNFMCAECGYVTKWKHYLNVHMRKHAGDLSYRQALQNHENCKHTKLKEFRCALCFYSSFSSISLFLHKRKAHGYVPGDKAWLENYAAKEKERTSAEFLQDFYNKPSTATGHSTEGRPASQREQSGPPDAADHSASKGTVPGSQTLDAVHVFEVVSQEVVNEGVSESPPSENSPEEYCTLILTTLSTTDYQTPLMQQVEENCPAQDPRTSSSDPSQKKADSSVSSSEEDNEAMAHEECELSDREDSFKPLNKSTSPPAESGRCQALEEQSDGEAISLVLPPEQNQPLDSEVRLEAMKKHDKDQADAMLLEGRVQMLVVPTKDAVYRCDKCSYVAYEEMALKHHCQALCQGKIKELKCQACGARFKQKRGLDSHRVKKCPALPRKTRTFVGISNVATVERHLSSCQKQIWKRENRVFSKEDKSDKEALKEKEGSEDEDNGKIKKKRLIFSCPNCAFKCSQKRAMDSHKKRGCLKPGEVQSSVDKSDISLTRHMPLVQKKRKGKVADPKRLHCQHCTFTCKQQRCMKQHVALKHNGVRPHRCRYCPFATTRRYRLEEHESLHTGIGRHKCDVCDKTFGAVTKLRQHKIRIHDKHPTHFCSLCDFCGYTLDDVRRHNLRCHTGELEHTCTHCDARFSSEIALRNHCKRVHQLQVCFPCKQCDYTCSSEVMLKAHQQSKHHQVKCTTCQECFETKESLELHQRTHLSHQCQLCPFATKTRQLLAQHLLNAHEEGPLEDRPLKCSICQFACQHQLVLEQHLRSHGGKRLYKCTDCEYSTRNKQKITWHIRIHTGEKPYSCEQCSYTCTDPSRLKVSSRFKDTRCGNMSANREGRLGKWSQEPKSPATTFESYTDEETNGVSKKFWTLQWCTIVVAHKDFSQHPSLLHMRVHQEEKKYLCPDCGYKCKWATQLKYHMTKHTGEKPYACDECDYRTNRADALRAHRDTQHCDMRPYVCEKCGKAFKTSFILKTHQRQHSDDRPYTCGLCNKAFRWPAGLRHHYLSHTKQQPFCCRHCSYRAKQKFQVVKHLQRHHPEMSVEEGVLRDSEAGGLTLKEALQGTLDETAAQVEEEGGAIKVAVVAEGVDEVLTGCMPPGCSVLGAGPPGGLKMEPSCEHRYIWKPSSDMATCFLAAQKNANGCTCWPLSLWGQWDASSICDLALLQVLDQLSEPALGGGVILQHLGE